MSNDPNYPAEKHPRAPGAEPRYPIEPQPDTPEAYVAMQHRNIAAFEEYQRNNPDE